MEDRPSLFLVDSLLFSLSKNSFFFENIKEKKGIGQTRPDTAGTQTGPSDSPEGYRARVSKEVDLFLSFYLVWEMLLLARPNFNSKTVSNHLLNLFGESDGKLLFRSTQPSRPPLPPPHYQQRLPRSLPWQKSHM